MKSQNSRNNLPIRMNCVQVFLFTLLACGMMCTNANAQLYTRTTFNTAYVPISVGTGATVSTATGNDVNQTAIPLGFTLNYAGVNYTTLGLNTNGLLWFDAIAPSAAEGAFNANMVVAGFGGTDQSISAWWADMTDDASSDILYQTQGTAGSQTFTVQYTNYPHWRSTGGTNVRLNFQVIFYEGTNVIEFNYGTRAVTGPPTVSTGAMIGIEYGAGGAGNFIDLVTGSGQTAHGMLSPLVAWPSYSYRLTPGAPTPVGAGTYNVGIGQAYPSLTLATSDLNHRGISGPITLNLTDNNYDTTVANGSHIFPVFVGPFIGSNSVNTVTISKTGTPATFSYRGSPVTSGGFGYGGTNASGLSAIDDTEEPIMGVCARYATISNINLVSLGTTANDVEVGLMVFESFGGDSGAHHNVFDKISINMDRTNTSTYGIWSKNITAPGGFQGTNSFNTYRDITIRDSYLGIVLNGVGTATGPPDAGNVITTSSCTIFNSIGDPNVPNDIGECGIRLTAQEYFVVKNNIVRNVSSTSNTANIEGIAIETFFEEGEVSNNIVRTVTRNHATSSNPAVGIKLTTSGNQIKFLNVFNNSVSEILSTYSGAATALPKAIGIRVVGTGNIGKQKMYIWNNSVSIDGSSFLNGTTYCLQISEESAEHIVKNNVFANFTAAQTGVAKHYCFVTYADTAIGYSPIVSASDYNDMYIANDQGTSGHVGLGGIVNYSTLAAWQAGITKQALTDANSVSANPNFVNNNSDLHATSLSTALDETGTAIPAFYSTDIDCETRVAPHDIGFDDFTSGCAAPPVPTGSATQNFCSGSNLTVANLTATGAAIQWYAASSGGSALATSTPLVNGTHYYATQTVGSCESTARLDVTALVSTAPPANSVSSIGGTAGACDGDIVLMTSNTVPGQNIRYSWNTGSNSSVVLFSNNIGGPFSAGPFESFTSSVYAQFGTLSQGSSGYNICVQGVNGCGTTNNKCTWIRGVVSPPASITGSAIQCDNATAQPYSAASVSGATIYTWSFPGATITTQGNQSVNIDFPAFTSGQLCVTAALTCGGSSTSAPKCMTVSNTTINPGAMSGPAKICPGQTGTVYSIPAIAGASTYNWTVPTGTTITGGAGTNSITVSWPNPYTLNANVCVTAASICGDLSAPRCKSVMSSIPSTPGYIGGQSAGVCGQTIVYSVALVTGATSYTWVVPAGGTINSGQGTNSINVTWGIITTGQITITANSACGSSGLRTLNIAGAPATPGTILQLPAVVCNGGPANFNITSVTGATGYIWTVPANGSSIDNGQGTTSIDVTWGTGNGAVTVRSQNGCGISGSRILNVSPGCRLASLSSTGSEQTARDDNFTVYPNPAHDMATISFNATAGNCEITIMDLSARIIRTINVSAKEGMNNIEVDLNRIAKGVYIVALNTVTSIEKSKLIIE